MLLLEIKAHDFELELKFVGCRLSPLTLAFGFTASVGYGFHRCTPFNVIDSRTWECHRVSRNLWSH